MATSGDLARAFSELVSISFSRVDWIGRQLRRGELLNTKGRGRGAARMTAQDAATWLVALLIDHEHFGDFARETKRVLSLPLHEVVFYPAHFGDDLACKSAKTAGAAI